MLQLPNNCRLGKFTVFPANWKTVRANAKLTWRISYWFYDDNLNVRKKVVIKGMNMLPTASEKQGAVKVILEDEEDLLLRQGYNPITKTYSEVNDAEISEHTCFPDALDYAYKSLKAEHNTKIDIKSCLDYIKQAIDKLGYKRIPIGQIKRKHLKLILDKCGQIKEQLTIKKNGRLIQGRWTANTYNHYRKYLSVLYKELLEVDAVEANLLLHISKQSTVEKIRETLSDDERKLINEHLYKNYYSFWRFMQIFFHSGARIVELLQVNKADVDTLQQRFKMIIKKGKKKRQVWRPIKDIAMPFWNEILSMAGHDHYLFSVGLVPGDRVIRREQVTRRWEEHVKKKLKITADFYSLKHSNLDEVAAQLNIKDAQAMAAHTTPVITLKYATNEKDRQDDRLKKISNPFA